MAGPWGILREDTERMDHGRIYDHQIVNKIVRVDAFCGLPQECLRRLVDGARLICVQGGEFLYIKGAPSTDLYAVVSGQIKIYLPLANGAEKLISLVGKGGVIGMAEAFLDEPYQAYAVAKSESSLFAFGRHTLLSQACLDAGLACNLLGTVSRQMLGMMRNLENYAPRTSLQRVSSYILQFRPDAHASRYEFVLPNSKGELAFQLNMAQETLSRAFHQMAEENIISIHGRLIRVHDCAKLLEINI